MKTSLIGSGILGLILGLGQFSNASACDRVVYTTYRPVVVQKVVTQPVVVVPTVKVARVEVEPVTITKVVSVAAPIRLPSMEAGGTYRARVDFPGSDAGFVVLVVGNVKQHCEIQGWASQQVTFTLPALGVNGDTTAHLEIIKSNGDLARRIAINLTQPADLVEVSAGDAMVNKPLKPAQRNGRVSLDGLPNAVAPSVPVEAPVAPSEGA
ncbi:MAG: hypothetical protein SFX18_10985 [Pirellulales bacterium]|nr:hypothetical protein [Pirellulales bacterium]